MADAPGYLLSEQALRKLVDDHRRLSHDVYSLKQQLAQRNDVSPWPRELFWGRTTDGGDTYPTTGNTFLVELIDRTFDNTVGSQAVTDTIGGSAPTVEARTIDGSYQMEGAICKLEKQWSREGWRYWIIPVPAIGGLWIRNDSGATRNKGEALEVTGVVSTPIADETEVLTGDLRAIEAARGILLADVADGYVAPFALAGLVYAEIDILDEDHTHCYVKTSDANPQSNFGGPWRIVAKPTGTGNAQPALLLLGDPCYTRKAKPDATLTAGSYADCSFYIDGVDLGSERVYYDWMEAGFPTIASGTEMVVQWYDDEEKWGVLQVECQG